MDIRCPKCGEPWEFDTLHEAAEEQNTTYEKVAAEFCRRGCKAIDANVTCVAHRGDKSDWDAARKMFEDFDAMGVFD